MGPATVQVSLLDLPSFSAVPWQMSFGERAVIEGVLSQLRPRLSLEIGTAEGGSLSRIAAHSERVVSFDLVEPEEDVRNLPNVELRTGDSHELLAAELRKLERAGEMIDFVLIDGDHTADGARRDMEDVLGSGAVQNAIVLAHDTLNPDVRRGLEAVPYAEIGKVAYVDLDFVAGHVTAEPPPGGECWGGLGLIVADESRRFGPAHEGRRPRMIPLSDLVWPSVERRLGTAHTADSADSAEMVARMESSLSWRLTAPLRAAKRLLRRS